MTEDRDVNRYEDLLKHIEVHELVDDIETAEKAECPQWFLDGACQPKRGSRKPKTVDSSDGGAIAKGARNDRLFKMASSMRGQGATFDSIKGALMPINQVLCRPPLEDAEVIAIARSAAGYAPDDEKTQVTYALTDMGSADLFADLHSGRLRFNWNRKKWVYFDGVLWSAELGTIKAYELSKLTVRSIVNQITRDMPDEEKKQIRTWAKRSESKARIEAMLSLASHSAKMSTFNRDYDGDGYLLNCLNGTIDLKTGTLLPHRPEHMMTKLVPVNYDPEASLPLWDEFLQTVSGGNQAMVDFLQVAAGYTIIGSNPEEKMFFVHGPGASGKSSFLEALKTVLGDYAKTADFSTFLKKANCGIRNDIARLAGARLCLSIEVDEGQALAEALIKTITGGDTITARYLYSEAEEFTPDLTLWLAANDAPTVSDLDCGIWRRILRLPFDNVIPVEKRDPKLKSTLKDTAVAGPAILAWLVKGCLRWQAEGLVEPDFVTDATQEYRKSLDPLADFFSDVCVVAPDASIPVTELRAAYDEWAREQGLRFSLSPKDFNKRVAAKGAVRKTMAVGSGSERRQAKRAKCWIGITLRINVMMNEEEEGNTAA